jgi:aminoglycoside phosphotransferase (APT) family kinase protein
MLPDGTQAFVKIGVDESTKRWAAKEVQTYRMLAEHGYAHAPSLLAVSDDETGFAIEALPATKGWDWTDAWTEARLTATLEAMDTLAGLPLTPDQRAYFAVSTINETQDGWRQLAADADSQRALTDKLRAAGRTDIVDKLDITQAARQSAPFTFTQDTFVHNDVRADNCAWNAASGQVRLVDWNWAQLGDKRIDTNALLVNVHKAGMDVTNHYADYLDTASLHWLAGYWLNAATQPLWPGAPEKSTLREYQLASGMIAFDLAQSTAAHI